MSKGKGTRPDMIGNKYSTGRTPKIDESNIDEITQSMLAFFEDKYEKFVEEVRTWKTVYETIEEKEIKRGRNEPLVDVPFYSDFAKEVGISYRTLKECEEKDNKSFSQTWQRCKEVQGRYIAFATMNGLSHPSFSIFFAANLTDWKQKQELTGKDGAPLLEGVEITVRK